jgi:hypothetical protein
LPQHTPVQEHDQHKKSQMKTYADNRGTIRVKDIDIGDYVLVRRHRYVPKHMSPYIPQPFTVTSKHGSLITAQRNTHTFTRNSSFFKKYTGPLSQHPDSDDESDIVTSSRDTPPQPNQLRRNPPRNRQPPPHLRDLVS